MDLSIVLNYLLIFLSNKENKPRQFMMSSRRQGGRGVHQGQGGSPGRGVRRRRGFPWRRGVSPEAESSPRADGSPPPVGLYREAILTRRLVVLVRCKLLVRVLESGSLSIGLLLCFGVCDSYVFS